MIANIEIMEVIAEKVREHRIHRLVIDPVMIAKSGHALLKEDARDALKRLLIPLATVITPNLPEAEVLTGMSLTTMEQRKEAAKRLLDLGVHAVVIKGGHTDDEEAVDLFYDGREFRTLSAPRFHTRHTHGTGCTFSAAITAGLAKGESLWEAVKTAKAFITEAIRHPLDLGQGHGPTNHWAYRQTT